MVREKDLIGGWSVYREMVGLLRITKPLNKLVEFVNKCHFLRLSPARLLLTLQQQLLPEGSWGESTGSRPRALIGHRPVLMATFPCERSQGLLSSFRYR